MATKAPRPKDKLGKRLATAFMASQGMHLHESEVEVIYLRLLRLQELEAFAEKRDWESIALYCPTNNRA